MLVLEIIFFVNCIPNSSHWGGVPGVLGILPLASTSSPDTAPWGKVCRRSCMRENLHLTRETQWGWWIPGGLL